MKETETKAAASSKTDHAHFALLLNLTLKRFLFSVGTEDREKTAYDLSYGNFLARVGALLSGGSPAKTQQIFVAELLNAKELVKKEVESDLLYTFREHRRLLPDAFDPFLFAVGRTQRLDEQELKALTERALGALTVLAVA